MATYAQLVGVDRLKLVNGQIDSVSLSIADHDVLTGWLHISFSDGGCGFGGYCLGSLASPLSSRNYAASFIIRCCETLGVETWEDLKGKPLRCLHAGIGGSIVAIGHFMKDQWFCPSQEWPSTEL